MKNIKSYIEFNESLKLEDFKEDKDGRWIVDDDEYNRENFKEYIGKRYKIPIPKAHCKKVE